MDGKIVLVTGATQGVGRAIAATLSAAGAAGLLLTGRDERRGTEAAAGLGPRATFVAGDLADPAVPARLVAACLRQFGRIDALVNAAGLTTRGSLLDADTALWDRLFAVNARAPFLLMQAAVAEMRSAGNGGAIVNILSMNAHCGAPDLAVYSASKGALATLTRNAANAHRFDRIRINGINMGWSPTEGEQVMQADTLGHGPDWASEASAAQPFGRLLAPEDVAHLAVFLLSDAAGPMTGALIDQEQWVAGARS